MDSPFLRRLLLALAPWPFLPSVVHPRIVRLSPLTAAKRAGYLVAFAGVVTTLSRRHPRALLPVAVASGAATALELWRGRRSFGRRSGLPPGALRLVPLAGYLDHGHIQALLRRNGSVAKANLPRFVGSNTVCVRGLDLGARILGQEEQDRLRWPGIIYDEIVPAGFLRSMSPDDHTTYRRLLRTALDDHVLRERAPDLALLSRTTVDAIAHAAHRAAPEGIEPREYLRQHAVDALCQVFFGIEPGTTESARARRLLAQQGPLGEYPRGGVEGIRAGALELAAIADRLARETLATTEERAPSSFASRLAAAHPNAFRDPNVRLNLVFICSTAARDITGLLHWVVTMLAGAPAWQDRVRADPTGNAPTWIVRETLRLEQSEFIVRRVREPIEVEGYTIPPGWLLKICVRESHRECPAFVEPETFDPGRFESSRFKRSEYAPFGMLRHACLGVGTTMAITEEFVRALATAYETRVVADGPVEYDHAHWRPSRRQRLAFEPVAPPSYEPVDACPRQHGMLA